MLYYDRIDLIEGIDLNKNKSIKECMICHCSYFFCVGLNFQNFVCNGCHDFDNIVP